MLQKVLTDKTTIALWGKLVTPYMTKSLTDRLVLKQRLYTFRLDEGEHLNGHISQFVTFLNDLKNVEVNIDDKDQVTLLLYSLPPSYKSFKENMIYSKDKLSFEDMKENLLSKNKLNNEFGLDSKLDKQTSILVVRSKTGSKSRNRDNTCGYCNKLGYIKAKCYKLQNKNKRVVESNERAVANASVAEDQGDDWLLVPIIKRFELMSMWILDSKFSFHMCPNKDLFSTYNPIEDGVVLMGNKSPCKIIDISTIQIRMHEESLGHCQISGMCLTRKRISSL